ncbi:MAG: putative DNA-binding domain-containing protein [Idiomarina sp.]
MTKEYDFQKLQKRFAEYLRNPQQHSFHDIAEQRRLHVYRDLIRNNLQSFLNSAFPVSRKVLGEDLWRLTGDAFRASHQAQSPYFADISGDFVDHLQSADIQALQPYPFIRELVHYEWVELRVSLDHLPENLNLVTEASIAQAQLVVNPTAQILRYQFPVHEVTVDNQPQEPLSEAILLVVFKNAQGAVKFMQLSPLTALLLQHLQQHKALTLVQLQQAMQAALPQFNPATLASGMRETLTEFGAKGLIVYRL